jgi:hypothetical protein
MVLLLLDPGSRPPQAELAGMTNCYQSLDLPLNPPLEKGDFLILFWLFTLLLINSHFQ